MVNFGKFLEDNIVEEYAGKYFKYNELKEELYLAADEKLGSHSKLYRDLETSYNTTKNFILTTIKNFEELINTKQYTERTIGEALSFNQFVYINEEAIRKFIKKHDKVLPNNRLYVIWKWKMDFEVAERIMDIVLGTIDSVNLTDSESDSSEASFTKPLPLSINLSDINPDQTALLEQNLRAPRLTENENITMDANTYDTVDLMEAGEANGDVEKEKKEKFTKQDDSFVRQSTKYWVKTCDLAAVVSIIGNYLSVSRFENGSPWTKVSSVYLDNQARKCYQERIRKDTGARIIRFRCYNDDKSKVFIERKVHHEKWTGEVSSKDRFYISEKDVVKYMRGYKLQNCPKKSLNLSEELQTMVSSYQLFPTLRVDYTRIAFQPEDHDHVRISIDLNMKYIREKCNHHEWYTEDAALQESDEAPFPYAVIEIKLREPFISKPPTWLNNLTQSSLLRKENNFSKYIHGTYQFDGQQLNLRRPSWYDNQQFCSVQLPVSEGKKIFTSDKNVDTEASHWFSKLLGIKPKTSIDGVPLKVEPKTFFANERTFLTWFNSAVFVMSLGLAIAATGERALFASIAMISIGVLIITYASFTYAQRTNSLLKKKPVGYADKYGPLILGGIISVVFVAAAVNMSV